MEYVMQKLQAAQIHEMPTCCWPLAKSQMAQGVEEDAK